MPVDECVANEVIEIVPDNPNFPGGQISRACATLNEAVQTLIVVPVSDETNVTVAQLASGCANCGELDCPPLNAWVFDPNRWQYLDSPPRFVSTISAAPGSNGCCVYINLDYVLPVELAMFAALPHEASITLQWTTASERKVDHHELQKDGMLIAHVQAENRATGFEYAWTDIAVIFGQCYEYTLVCVALAVTVLRLVLLNPVQASPVA